MNDKSYAATLLELKELRSENRELRKRLSLSQRNPQSPDTDQDHCMIPLYRQGLKYLKEIIFMIDGSGTIISANPAVEEVCGLSRNHFTGLHFDDLAPPSRGNLHFSDIVSRIKRDSPWRGSISLESKKGSPVETEGTIALVMTGGDEGILYISVLRDVTYERLLQKRVLQSQKMEAMGNLAGGIAHDLNNILGAITGHSELSLREGNSHSLREGLEKILAASLRASDLVKQILTFHRERSLRHTPLRISPIIGEVLQLLDFSRPRGIRIQKEIIDESATVMADPTQIHQILMNLCSNSLHAMGARGVLTILLYSEFFQGDEKSLPGHYVILSVKDTGPGMGPEVLKQIFDPFFTTRDREGGFGMGLSVVQGIVSEYGGFISVKSNPKKGSLFKIHIPAWNYPQAMPVAATERSRHGSERILLVDDEEVLVRLTESMLKELGYEVRGYTGGVEALETFKSSPHAFDLVITDQVMPGLTGTELARRIKEIRPEIPVILASGYALPSPEGTILPFDRSITKPLTRATLDSLIRKVMYNSPQR